MNFQEYVVHLMQQYPHWALAISLLINTAIAIAGVVPSVFVTAANILFFGFTNGVLVSIAGESLGAAVSFLLYRYWFQQRMQSNMQRYPKAKALAEATGAKAAGLVIALRLLPMVPSGIVTFAAAIGRISAPLFIVSSTIGKFPALLLEAAMVKGFLQSGWQVQIVLTGIAILVAWLVLRKKNRGL